MVGTSNLGSWNGHWLYWIVLWGALRLPKLYMKMLYCCSVKQAHIGTAVRTEVGQVPQFLSESWNGYWDLEVSINGVRKMDGLHYSNGKFGTSLCGGTRELQCAPHKGILNHIHICLYRIILVSYLQCTIMCVYMYIYICTYIYIFMYVYIHICIESHTTLTLLMWFSVD